MACEYYKIYECDCGKIIKKLCLDLSNNIPHISAIDFSQEQFECPFCGAEYALGYISVLKFKDGDEEKQ